MSGGARTAPAACAGGSGAMLSGLAVASMAAAALLAGADAASATSDTTFGDPLDAMENIVGGTGAQLATALAVGAALVGRAIV